MRTLNSFSGENGALQFPFYLFFSFFLFFPSEQFSRVQLSRLEQEKFIILFRMVSPIVHFIWVGWGTSAVQWFDV